MSQETQNRAPAGTRPKLRALERHRLIRDGEALVVLRDRLGVSDPVALPEAALPLLDLLNGERTAAQIRQTLRFRGEPLDAAEIDGLLADLGDAGLLDDATFRERWRELHAAFLAAPTRPPRYAGLLYPEAPEELAASLTRLLGPAAPRLVADDAEGRHGPRVAGLILPHQPFERSAAILDRTLRGLPPATAVDLVVVLGADPHPSLTPYTITDKIFETPLGPVRSDRQRIAGLCRRLEWLTREEIRHREALSIELVAILLRYLYGEGCPPILPVLCGGGGGGAAGLVADEVSAAAEALQAELSELAEDPRILWVVSAELGHCGPAYGGPPLTAASSEHLAARDHGLVDALARGHLHDFRRRAVAEDPELGPPSGAAALLAFGRLVPPGLVAEAIEYAILPAPGDEPGLAGIAGLRLRRVT